MMITTYTCMRGWRDGEMMQPHQHGGPFDTVEEAAEYADRNGGYVRRDSDGATLEGSDWIPHGSAPQAA